MPQDRTRLAGLVTARIDARDLRGALEACRALNAEFPDYAHGWYLASYLLRKTRNHADALRAVDRALDLEQSGRYLLQRVKCLLESGDLAAARAGAAGLLGRDLGDAMLHDDLGAVLHQLGDQRAARDQYQRAIALDPRNAQHHYNLAAVLRYLGDAEGAEAAYDAAISLRPHDYEAYNGRAQLRRQTRERNHVAGIEAVLATATSPAGRVELCHALAKELEDLGDFDASFARLKEGADLKRRHMRYDVRTDLDIMRRIAEVFGGNQVAGTQAGTVGEEAIFVFGLPRTGTTLVERILASHPEVCAAGELSTFSVALTRMVQALPGVPPASRLDFVDRAATIDFQVLGKTYLDSTLPHRDARLRFVDKLPFNYLYAGLIHRALPRARIVSLERHPMDSCYSIYKQLFRDAYPFSYDLDDLGRYFIAYTELMRHWRAAMPGVIHTVRYEDLVADLEGEARRLLEYCGLAWDERCLRFHENAAASTTASALQVRQPIYGDSIGRWRNYARQLEPLRARLASAGIFTD
jgi:Flp pilus assembly protein TadD